MLIFDGVSYDVKFDVKRTANITSSDISGMLLDKSYFIDVIGTYMSYQVTLKYPLRDQNKYAGLYEALISPVDGHQFTMPYNQGSLNVTARVVTVPDQRIVLESGREYWQALQFQIVANHPSKTMSLGEVIARGRSPLPEIAGPQEGDSFTWTNNHWEHSVSYDDADLIAY